MSATQTTCATCGSDIEGSPGNWIDRGGNTTCANSGAARYDRDGNPVPFPAGVCHAPVATNTSCPTFDLESNYFAARPALSAWLELGYELHEFEDHYWGTYQDVEEAVDRLWWDTYGEQFDELNIPALRFDRDEFRLILTCNDGWSFVDTPDGVAVFSP